MKVLIANELIDLSLVYRIKDFDNWITLYLINHKSTENRISFDMCTFAEELYGHDCENTQEYEECCEKFTKFKTKVKELYAQSKLIDLPTINFE